MDEKYIEHLGMSQHVDEGLWDRLKSKAAAFSQGVKNIAGGRIGDVGTVEAAKFNSLFKNFVSNELSLIKSLMSALKPWLQYATDKEAEQIMQIQDLDHALRSIDFKKLPVTEALPSFSNIGARIQGGVSNILNSYKNRIAATYDSFLNDVRRMNIVPEQYIARKIVSSVPGAKEALEALSKVTGKPISGLTPTPAPTPTPASKLATPAPTPAPKLATPAPIPSTAAPSAPTPTSPTVPTPTAHTTPPETSKPLKASDKLIPATLDDRQAEAVAVFKLSQQAIQKIIKEIPASAHGLSEALKSPEDEKEDANLDMLGIIKKYWGRDATKASHPFSKEPTVNVFYEKDKIHTYWDMRWKFVKEIYGHSIEISSIDKQVDPSGAVKVLRESNWIPFLKWNANNVIDEKTGGPKFNIDPFSLIEQATPAIAKLIREAEQLMKTKFFDPVTSKKLINSLYSITLIVAREPERGKKQLGGGEPELELEPERRAASKMSAVAGAPEKPEAPGDIKNVPPEKKGRSGSIEEPPAKGEKPKKEPTPTTAAPTSSKSSKSSPTEPSKAEEPKKKVEPDEGEKAPPFSKLKDLVPKTVKTGKPAEIPKPEKTKAPGPKITSKADEPKKAPAPSTVVAAPKPAAEKPEVVAPKLPEKPIISPKPAPPASTAPLGGEEYIDKFNKKYTEPYGLSPLKTREQIKAFWDAVGVVGTGEVPDWKIKGAHQVVTGQKPAASATPSAPVAKPTAPPKKKVKEGIEYRDFFSL